MSIDRIPGMESGIPETRRRPILDEVNRRAVNRKKLLGFDEVCDIAGDVGE